MSSTGHLPELESLRTQVAVLARELAERDQAMQARQQDIDGELEDLRKQSNLLRAIMEGTAAAGDDFFASLATHLTSTLHMQYAVIGEVLDGTPARIRTLAVSSGGHLLENFEYDLAQAPCGTGLTESFWCFTQGVQTLFPNFPTLATMGAESHSGVSIRDKQGKVVGLIVVMDTKPIAHQDQLQALLQVFAPRVAAELQRKQAEHDYRQALHALENIMETVPDIMFTLDIQGNMMKWNHRVEEVTGYTSEELHGKSALAFVPAHEQEQTALAIQRAFTDGKAELEGHLLTKDQRLIPYHWTGAALKDRQDRIIGITGIGRDVSAQKHAAEALQRQRHHLLEAQALAQLGSWEWEIESGETDWSEEQFRIFGHEPGALAITYDTFLAALLPDDHDRVLAAVNDTLLGKCPFDVECRIVRPNGDIRVIHMRADVQRDATGHPVRMAGTALDITERKQTEEALRASEERWHLAVQGSNDGIWDWNIQTGDVFFSPRWKAMRGFQEHELRNQIDEWRSRIHPDDLDRVLRGIDRYLAKQTSGFCEEYRVQRNDGSYLWILDRGLALWSNDGTAVRMTGSESDITERKRAEEALAQSRDRLTSFVENTPVAVAMLDKDFRYLAVSQRWLQDYRLGDQNLIGKHHYDVFPEIRQMTEWQAIHQRCLAGAVEQCEEDRFIREDGSEDWLRWEVRPWHDVTGKIGGIIMYTEVITERKRAEVALRESEARTRSILETALDAVISINEYGRIIGWNPQAEVMFGYSAHEVLGLPLDETIIPARYRQSHAHGMNRMLQRDGGSALRRRFEFFALHRNGHEFPVEFAIASSEVGGQPMFTAFIRDITERKQAEASLRTSEEKLRQSLQASNTGLWDWNTDTNEVSFSREWKRQLGYEEAELANTFESWETRLHPEDHDRAIMHVRTYLANPVGDYQQEFRLRHKDGTYRWIQARAAFVTEPDGRRVRLLGSHMDITDRKRTEEALKRSERQLRTVLDTLPIGVWFTDEMGLVLYGNPVGQRIWAEAARVGLPQPGGDNLWWETIDKTESLHRWAVGTVLTRGQNVLNETLEIETNGGDRRTLLNSAVPVKGDAGDILGAIVLNEDITDRIRAERALRQEHALLMAVMDAATDIIFVKDIAGRYIHMNRAGARTLGMPVEDVIGWTEYALWPSELAKSCQLADHRVLETGEPVTVEETSTSDGKTTTYLTTKAPYRDNEGRIIGVIGVSRDITERKQAEEDLRRSHAFIRQIIDTDPNFIFAKDREGRFTLVNKTVAEAYGTSVEQLIGKTDAIFNSNTRGLEHVRKTDLEVMDSLHEQFIAEEVMTDAAGHTRWLQTVKRPILNESGRATMVLSASTDITERKHMEEVLRQRERDLRAAINERERISQDLHDGILQSLYAVGLGLEACKPLVTQRHYKKARATMSEAIGQLNHVMSEVRNFIAGLESQMLQGSTFPSALQEMVTSLAAAHPLRCRVTVDKTAADHISTHQALHLLNIVREALSNSRRHAQATKTTVALKQLSRCIRLSIVDNGIGFEPASLRGVGHGLTNMAARARKVGGRFAVRSVPQHGTRITIDLPKENIHAESESEDGSTAARR